MPCVLGSIGWEVIPLNILGISEEERARRRVNNCVSTTINFVAWLIEVNIQNIDCN